MGDPFNGYVLQVEHRPILALDPEPAGTPLASGSLIVRYGIRYLGKYHLSVVPGLVVLDYGDFLTGEEAWSFLRQGSNLYPRSEVIGYRNDGQDEMIVIKLLDVGIPPEVLVYADPAATTPIAKPHAVIAPDDAELPARLLEFLPRFDSVADWQLTL